MTRQAIFMVLSSKAKDKEMILLDKIELAKAKTKQMVAIVDNLGKKLKKNLIKGTLVVLPTTDQKIIRASQNIPKIKITRADSLNVLDILSHQYLLISQGAIETIKKTYLK
jgi:large subunit ribosomal protein L4